MQLKGLVCNYDLKSLTVAQIEKATEEIIAKYDSAYTKIGQITDVTFENTIKALIDLEREMITEEGPICLPQHVVTDKVAFINHLDGRNLVKMQPKCSQHSVKIQSKFSQNSVTSCSSYRLKTFQAFLAFWTYRRIKVIYCSLQ